MDAAMGTDKAARQGEISKEFVRLNDSKEQLNSRIEVLCNKLQDLMRKEEPSKETCQPSTPLQSQFAMELSGVSSTIETDLEKINDILNRLEL